MRNQNVYYDDDDDDGPDVVPDGGSVRVPLHLCDSVQRRFATVVRAAVVDANAGRPHFATLADEQRRRRAEARDAWIRCTENAWRTAGRDAVKPEPDDLTELDDPDEDGISDQIRRERARNRYLDQLQNAWKTPTRLVAGWGPSAAGPGPAFTGTGRPTPGETGDSTHRPHLSLADANAKRNAAYAEYCNRLSNAWRNP